MSFPFLPLFDFLSKIPHSNDFHFGSGAIILISGIFTWLTFIIVVGSSSIFKRESELTKQAWNCLWFGFFGGIFGGYLSALLIIFMVGFIIWRIVRYFYCLYRT
ncbi:hypothetical protein AUK11_00380 [bacterium CG2_30_37_16]|nr:MAG: hypothetical protein AUK11_00380 [bacterium CG2_30_37_16]PIP30376.1 MAG: hypothetical protein COX25_04780 [bacterium (Candidatus Howlettbacteria) CG23_combo_of_CG06-09_8_20_14_all_37_9]PIX99405.1 MAG: hypothetical protein COZ22_02575 [bacterium (Candidatus Howlettbacteria) CG_4_10_14_3_um_filter_37_10]PJB05861.1 MAG: hypothetical protein CO123_03050 [bacterium (Candidatus Howlettbacteria) CG_4_9_14_3_um_filter_37_10]